MVRVAASVAMVSMTMGCTTGGLPDYFSPGSGGVPNTGGAAVVGSGGVQVAGGQGPAAATRGGSNGAMGGATGHGGEGTVTVSNTGGASTRGGTTVASGGSGHGGSAGALTGTQVSSQTCASLPQVTDYGAPGPFTDAKMFTNVGPNGKYTLFRPDATLGRNGFLHPIAAWGNGISTTPDMYQKTLPLIASHGFVVIACNDTQVEEPCLTAGLDWLVQQNSVSVPASGPMTGKLDTTREVLVGYSWGGGAAIDTAVRPNVKAIVSLHGMPPRESPWGKVRAPLLLFTSTGDNFVTASGYVTPNFVAATVQTFYATLNDSSVGHLYVVDQMATICIGSLLGSTFGNCGDDQLEHAPTIAWLRMWVCGDANAKRFFYGDSCVLCESPWTTPQRKNWP